MTTTLESLLSLSTPPVAIAFLDRAPEGMARVERAEAASCGYWRRAAAGQVFYTEAADHVNCPVGAHTHGAPTTEEQRGQLMDLIKTMVGLEYLSMDEIPQIPHRAGAFGVVAYAPLASAPFAPDVVMVRGNVQQMMLLAEAAQSAGIAGAAPTLGRPTCAVMPQAMQSARVSSSFGCVGNRVYTGLTDSEGYVAIPGAALAAIEARLAVIVRANQALAEFHQGRKAQFSA
jgi:uncharacterized protein (DUF169 family)